jgi:hypothetical protein
MVAELATRARMSERTLATQVERAVALVSHSDVHTALAAGTITASHAAVIVDEVESLVPADGPPPAPEVVQEFEQRLLERSALQTPGEVRRSARRWREKSLPESIEVRHQRAREARNFWVEPLADAVACLHIITGADKAARIHAEITSDAIRTQAAGDARTIDQLRADLMVDRVLRGATVRSAVDEATNDIARQEWPQILPGLRVLVTVPVFTLAGLSDEPGQLDGYGPVPPEMARRLVAHAPSLTRILTHPVTGAVLDVDRTVYKVPTALRTWLMLRDRACRFPCCTRKAVGCETDHTVAWEHGGATSADNLEHLCRKHHNLKHKTGWSVKQTAGGVLEWVSPAGVKHRTVPDDDPPV